MNKKFIVFLAIVVLLVQSACAFGGSTSETDASAPTQNVADQVATGVAQTQAAQLPLNPPTNTPEPVVFPPTITPELPTFTAVPAVQGTVNYGAFCRSGPGANFQSLLVYEFGSLVNVIGTNLALDQTTWWLVSSPGQAECWLIDAALSITGDKSSVIWVGSPPTPTSPPIPTWGGTWTYWMRGGFSGADDVSGKFTLTQSGNSVSTSFTQWNSQFNFVGTVSADGMTVNGSLISAWGGSWTVVFKRNASNLNQFRGSWRVVGLDSYDGDWCGATAGAAKPSPCKSQ